MKHTIAWLVITILTTFSLSAQEPTISFAPPFDFPLLLSGNFGELRSDHFHGGLDFKTQGVSGKIVRALADGYISKARVTAGSGYVLEVTYNNGYRTINRHLSAFLSPQKERIEEQQYASESWEVEIPFGSDEYPVKAGQPVALSGNTGYSMGPHLHLDVLDAEGDYVDPLPFFQTQLTDTRAPVAHGFMLFPQPGLGIVNNRTTPQRFSFGSSSRITAWGDIGVALKAYDYMNNTYNRFGVYMVTLSVDGQEIFRSEVDRFAPSETRLINAWTYNNYMKSFVDQGNTLRMLKPVDENRGIVHINEARDYLFQYTLRDRYGNTSRYRFVVHGKKQQIPEDTTPQKYRFLRDEINILQEPGMELSIPKGLLYANINLKYKSWLEPHALSYTYQLHDERVSMYKGAELHIGLLSRPTVDTTKYYVARVAPNGRLRYAGGRYADNFVRTTITELGTYTVAVDTIPPRVTPYNRARWSRNGHIVYKIEDKQSGIADYRATIDGQYALFAFHIMSDMIECRLDPKHVSRGKRHELEVTVTDRRGNTRIVKDTFTW